MMGLPVAVVVLLAVGIGALLLKLAAVLVLLCCHGCRARRDA